VVDIVVDGQYPRNYRWPDNAREVLDSHDIRIPTEALVHQIIAAEASPNHFGPFDNTSAGTQIVSAQRSM
jgi:hypothetical protein